MVQAVQVTPTSTGPLAAAQALYDASGGKITHAQLATMVAIAGPQTQWTNIMEDGTTPAQAGDADVGVGMWQQTPSTPDSSFPYGPGDLNLLTDAAATWYMMQQSMSATNNPYQPWALASNGYTPTASGGSSASTDYQYKAINYTPTPADYAAGVAAADAVFGKPLQSTGPNAAAVVAAAASTAATSTGAASTGGACPTGSSACGPTLLYDCYGFGLAKNKGSSSCLFSPPGGWCFTACEAKAMIAASFIGVGVMFSLIGLVMVFSRGKGLGKAAEVAGAGVQLIPGAEMVGAGMMAAGRHMQQKAGATKAASSASNAVVRQRAAAKQAPRQRASAPAPSNEDQMAAAHAQGVLTGRTQGRQRSTLSPSVATSGSGARYSELGGGEF